MVPRFKTVSDWEQAQILMQPCLIRVVDNLRKHLEENSTYQGSYEEVTEPIPGYQLSITHDQEIKLVVNIWELCFQVCFLEYEPSSNQEVQIDHSLIDETAEVDWQSLETKAQNLVNQLFLNLSDL